MFTIPLLLWFCADESGGIFNELVSNHIIECDLYYVHTGVFICWVKFELRYILVVIYEDEGIN